jgi:hypothetical protein
MTKTPLFPYRVKAFYAKIVKLVNVSDTTSRTPEDECKWFFTAIWFILLKQIDTVRHGPRLQSSRLQQLIAHDTHNDMYSVQGCLGVVTSPFPMPSDILGMSNLLHCLMPTARFLPCLAGRASLFALHSRWPHFPQGPRTSLSSCPLQ